MQITPRVQNLIELGLEEDEVGLDPGGRAPGLEGQAEAKIVAKQRLVVAGLDMISEVYRQLGGARNWDFKVEDGTEVCASTVVAETTATASTLLRGERLALNFVQRMCGIATMTSRYVSDLEHSGIELLDTRKTLPGYRELDKYAVWCGGGRNHRYNLSGGVMIKDNHIALAGGNIGRAVAETRKQTPPTLKIEVEVADLDQLEAAIEADADIVMLDNMSIDKMQKATSYVRKKVGNSVEIEASGDITKESIGRLTDLDIDYISVGALTHSVDAADLSMRMEG